MNASEKHDTNVAHPDVRISVQDFGPIANGTVDLRPLTVFVGPSNTGKTYFAILVYALHRILNGFPRLPVKNTGSNLLGLGLPYAKTSVGSADVSEDELRDVLGKLGTSGQPFTFSDLPTSVRDVLEANVKDTNLLGADLKGELERCFALESISHMVRSSDHAKEMKIFLDLSEEGENLWNFSMGTPISDSDVVTDGRIEDLVLLAEGWSDSESRLKQTVSRIQGMIREKEEGSESPLNSLFGSVFSSFHSLKDLPEEIINKAVASTEVGTHYLPAARSGIMQSHRVITSSLVARSARAGLEQFPEVPMLSGVTADFLQRLILYNEGSQFRHTVRQAGLQLFGGSASAVRISEFADVLERETLSGKIHTSESPVGGYPEFVYRPQESEKDIRLSRASSMVSELAPVVLFLRGVVGIGDMLIIEEPEAHLHPAAQTQMAVMLARLVRAGVRVVITTHSDWLLKEIGNLMREGELGEEMDENESAASRPSSLQSDDVGIWLFSRSGTSGGSTVEEIPFDRIEGVEPQDYEDVAEALYNRSADLQNRLEESSRSMQRRHE